MKILFVVLLIVLGIFSMAGAVEKGNLCSLLTKSDVESALNRKMKEPEKAGNGCVYATVDIPYDILIVEVEKGGISGFNQNKKNKAKAGKMKPVEGLGDDAYYDDRQLNILKKRDWISLQSSSLSLQTLQGLAKKVMERLK